MIRGRAEVIRGRAEVIRGRAEVNREIIKNSLKLILDH